MKRILILLCMLVCYSAIGQNIKKNEINEHGVRIIEAGTTAVVEDGMYLAIGLEYHKSLQGIENYYVTLLVPKGARSYAIKEGQEIKFKTINDEAVIGLAVSDFPCRYMSGEWAFIATYVISPETAEKLSQKVSKMRIHYTTAENENFFDVDTSGGLITRYFKRAYANIKKTIPQPVDKDRSEF